MVTFLFTDIEGSTRLWESRPEAMRIALERHDRLLRGLIEVNDGYVFKTVGDAFCASFARPTEALEAAVEMQRALLAEQWGEAPIKVRIGLHTGEAEERDGDYFGPPVNRVARLMAVGSGGQILLSSATAAMLRSSLSPGLTLSSLGTHRLKDLRDPEEIFQVSAKGLPGEFPPIKALDSYRHNLPIQLSSFIGRDTEVKELVGLVPGSRLLTLTGPGGCGKTRLALQVAGELVDRFSDGAWFVDLAPISDPYLLPLEIAAVFGVKEEVAENLPDLIAEAVGHRPRLLILDNCEHLVAACAALVARLLRSCEGLRVLATSREALGLGGEALYPVRPLSPPDACGRFDPASVGANECVRLFVERARAAMPSFSLGPANAPAVAQICARLDGIPLAIELAAARIRVLSADQILARLVDRFKLLTGGDRGAQRRQQTLRDLIGWSYDLLSREERRLLCSLSVFASGWDLESAEAICAARSDAASDAASDARGPARAVAGGDVGAEADILDLLEELVVKSLVIVDESGEGARFRMLESIREYARLKRVEEDDDESLADRHANWFLSRAEFEAGSLYGPDQAATIARLRVDAGNLLAAFEHLATRPGGTEEALRMAVALEWFQYRSGRYGESRKVLEEALALDAAEAAAGPGGASAGSPSAGTPSAGTPSARSPSARSPSARSPSAARMGLRARARVSLAWVLFAQGDLAAAREAYTAGLEASREAADPAAESRALTGLGVTVRWLGERKEGITFAEEGVARARASGDGRALTYALIWAYATLDGTYDGEPPQAGLEEGLALARRAGDRWAVAHLLDGLGDLHRALGRHEKAHSCYEESLGLFRELGDRFLEAYVLDGLAKNYLALGAKAQRALAPGGVAPGTGATGESAPGESAPGESAPGESAPGESAPGESALGESRPLFLQSLEMFASFGMRSSAAESILWLAYLASILGEATYASRLFGAFHALAPRDDEASLLARYPAIADAKAEVEEKAAADFAAGRLLSFEQALDFAAGRAP